MAIKIKNVKERVKHVLLTREDSRDCDQKLFALILYQELMTKSISDEAFNPETMNAKQLLKIMSLNKMTNFESVRRARALLQGCLKGCNCKVDKTECISEKYRGKKWAERKSYEVNVKNDIMVFDVCEHNYTNIKQNGVPMYYCMICKETKKIN